MSDRLAAEPGLSLREAVAAHGPMPPEPVLVLAAGLAEALLSIHRAGIVQRDLTPSNVMLTKDGPKVVDFGIAPVAEGEAVTRTDRLTGTPGFMSPEQGTGDDGGPAGDVFCLGAVLAFAATGSSPYGHGTLEVLTYRNAYENPRLEEIHDPRVRGLVADCMNRDPARRPTPETLLERLPVRPAGTSWLPGPLAAEVEKQARPAPSPPHRRRRRQAAIVALAVGCGIAAAAVVPDLFRSPPACDSDCEHRIADEKAFYQSWKPKLVTLADCTNGESCLKAADAVEEPLRTAIWLRPDASRYASAVDMLDNLRWARKQVDSCLDTPFREIGVGCASGQLANVKTFGGMLDANLSMVPYSSPRT